MKGWGLATLVLLLMGCADVGVRNPVGVVSSVDSATGELHQQPSLVLPDSNIEISAETGAVAAGIHVMGVPTGGLGFGGSLFSRVDAAVLYLVYDPLAPNWTVKERVVSADTVHLSMRAKSFRIGGDGEAYQILKRRATYLQRARGYSSYRITEYSEGIESSTPFTHRVGEGTIQLVRAETPVRR